jgi:hypothetical protein
MNILKNLVIMPGMSGMTKIRRVINWIFVMGFIVSGFALWGDFPKIGPIFIAIGIFISPYINELLKKATRVNYLPSTKAIVVLLGLAVTTGVLMYDNEKRLFVIFLIQTASLDENNDKQINNFRNYLEKEELKNKEKAFLASPDEQLAELQFLYEEGYYEEIITQGTPFVKFDTQIELWVTEAKKQLNDRQVDIALQEIPQLIKDAKYGKVYQMAAKFSETSPELEKSVTEAKKQLDKTLKNLRSWYRKGYYKKIIKNGTPYAEYDCRIGGVVNDAKKAQAKKIKLRRIAKAVKKTKYLIKKRQYEKAIKFASESEYANHPELRRLIKRAQLKQNRALEKKILAKLREIPSTQTEANIREYTILNQLFPESKKYQQKLDKYKKRFAKLRKQPPIFISQKEYGDEWPFTVSKGELECFHPGIVTFKTNHQTYAVNGLASSRGYKEIDEIWKNAPDQEELQMDDEFIVKVSIAAITVKGLELCNPQSESLAFHHSGI